MAPEGVHLHSPAVETPSGSGAGANRARLRSALRRWVVAYLPAGLAFLLVIVWPLSNGCMDSVPEGTLVITQVPPGPPRQEAATILDERYPAGSRVVMAFRPYGPMNLRVLSRGLLAAGDPIVSFDGQHIFFVGRASAGSQWQVYRASVRGGAPKVMTGMPGGAMDPTLSGSGHLVFSSPVPAPKAGWRARPVPALYAQTIGQRPTRLTFGAAAVEPTVLADGRILFVSVEPQTDPQEPAKLALFTVNNDGSEITAFAGEHEGAPFVHRPRQLRDGRVAFLEANVEPGTRQMWAEAVQMARPFASRAPLFNFPPLACRSIEPDGPDAVLVSSPTRPAAGRSMRGTYAIFRLRTDAAALGQPLFDDSSWDELEAIRVAPRPKPAGHLSAMLPDKKRGMLLCLNSNRSSYPPRPGSDSAQAQRVRVVGEMAPGEVYPLGEAPVQPDGSFLIEAPAEIPLGFETLDREGRIIRRLPPTIWLVGGENRACIGCHEPHNHAPANVRPLAANLPPVRIGLPASESTATPRVPRSLLQTAARPRLGTR